MPSTSSRKTELPLLTVLDEKHLVDGCQRTGAMGNHDNDAAHFTHLLHGGRQGLLTLDVEVRVRLVQNQEKRIAIKGASQSDTRCR